MSFTHWRYEEDSLEGHFSFGSEVSLGKRVGGIL